MSFIARAIIGWEEARGAQVRWLPDARLVPEVVRLAEQMGFGPDQIARVGELTEDLPFGDVVLRRGSVIESTIAMLWAAKSASSMRRPSGRMTATGRGAVVSLVHSTLSRM